MKGIVLHAELIRLQTAKEGIPKIEIPLISVKYRLDFVQEFRVLRSHPGDQRIQLRLQCILNLPVALWRLLQGSEKRGAPVSQHCEIAHQLIDWYCEHVLTVSHRNRLNSLFPVA